MTFVLNMKHGTCQQGTCICHSSHDGVDCQLDVRAPQYAMRERIFATWCNGNNFNELAETFAIPTFNYVWGYGNPIPRICSTFSILLNGYIRPIHIPMHMWKQLQHLDCMHSSHFQQSTIWINSSTNYHIRVEVTNNGGHASFQLRWNTPGSTAFAVIAQYFESTEYC